MNIAAIIIGIILMIIGAIFTVFTLGFGIICSWPVILIGFILFIAGFIMSGNKTTIIQQQQQQTIPQKSNERYCPDCGRSIPFDAQICPYCGKKFGARLKEE